MFEQNAVSRVVWRWQDRISSMEAAKPSVVKVVVQALVMFGIAAVLYFGFGHRQMGGVVSVLAVGVLTSGIFFPPLFLRIERFGLFLGRIVGVGLTWGLLVPFFYLCFVPGRLILWMLGKDPMKRTWETGKTTYWDDYSKPAVKESFRKQF